MRDPRSILITGASSGLGAALARAYAAPGVTLHLCGRDSERTAAIAEECSALGAAAAGQVLDVADRAAASAWVEACDAAAPVDLVIANAGVSGATAGVPEGEVARRIIATNIDGVLNTVQPLIPRMRARGRGQIAIMASLAAFRGYRGSAAYCASKAAVRAWGEGLRGELAGDGIAVSVICPGYVTTPMTAGNAHAMPLLMGAERAAAIIQRGLARNQGRIAFPLPMYLGALLALALPGWIADRAVKRFPLKERGR
jgi:NADP-dependent 3-hydroxy acid dehydrogenase YdfG